MVGLLAIISCCAINVIINYIRTDIYKMNNKPNEWEQGVIDNAVEYSIMEWRSLDRSTKTMVKTYEEAKELFKKTISSTIANIKLAIAIEEILNILASIKSENPRPTATMGIVAMINMYVNFL